jgi:AraC-like DNA-binding protein
MGIISDHTSHTKRSFFHYLPFSQEDRQLGMVCTTAGNIEVEPNTSYPPRKQQHPPLFRQVAEGRTLPEFQLVYITQGQGIFETAGTTYTVLPGSLLLLLPGIRHRYKPDYAIGWHEYWVGFYGDFFSNLLQRGILSKDRVFFDIGLHNSIVSIFSQILDEVSVQQPLYQFKACAGILSLIAEMLTHQRRQGQPTYYQKIVEKAKYLMESNSARAINISDIAEQIGVSISRLTEIFKTYTSMTPYQYYLHIKMHEAKSLLEEEGVSVKEVAYQLGFDDQYYFSRLFKHKTGIAPSKWKSFIHQ